MLTLSRGDKIIIRNDNGEAQVGISRDGEPPDLAESRIVVGDDTLEITFATAEKSVVGAPRGQEKELEAALKKQIAHQHEARQVPATAGAQRPCGVHPR
jgi:hypothetical protein